MDEEGRDVIAYLALVLLTLAAGTGGLWLWSPP
jgi:hypothetical protein